MEIPADSLRIVHYTALSGRGGATRVARLLIDECLVKKLDTVHVYALFDGEGRDGRLLAAGEEEAFFSGLTNKDVLHLHSATDWERVLKSASGRDFRIVLTMHDCRLITGGCVYPLDCEGWLGGCVCRCPQGIADASRWCARMRPLLGGGGIIRVSPSKWLAKMADAVLPGKTAIIPNGVFWPQERLSKREAAKRLGISAGSKIVLFAAHGGLKSGIYKGAHVWLDIWREIVKAGPKNVVAFVVGGEKTGRDGEVFYWPYLEQEAMRLVMSAADVLVYPAFADNHPLILLEAMAAGLPSVSFAVGGIVEQVIDGRNGLLVSPGDGAGMVGRVVYLLNSPGVADTMGNEAYAYGRKRFTSARMAGDYLKKYFSVKS